MSYRYSGDVRVLIYIAEERLLKVPSYKAQKFRLGGPDTEHRQTLQLQSRGLI